jgi:hypothetical protein
MAGSRGSREGGRAVLVSADGDPAVGRIGLWSAVAEGGEFGQPMERMEAHAPTVAGALVKLAAKLRSRSTAL